jgi:hypothetical protein
METVIEKLKSKKLWLALLGAVIPVINQQFNLHLDTDTVLGIEGVIGVAIGGIAHVDAKLAQAKAFLSQSPTTSQYDQVLSKVMELDNQLATSLASVKDSLAQLSALGVIPAPAQVVAVTPPTPAEQTPPVQSEPTV